MSALDDVLEVQRRVLDLQQSGTDMNSQEARRSMNRMMGLLRHLSPDELKQFEAWVKEERERRKMEG
jgi:hypothetical protein